MCVAVLTHDIGQRMPVLLGVGMVQAPWQTPQGEQDHGKPLCGRFVRWHPHVGHAPLLFAVAMGHRDGPALVRETQEVLCRYRQGRAQNILRVCVPRGPCAAEAPDVKRPMGAPPLEGSPQGRALSSVWSGPLHALLPLVSERLGPLGARLVVQLPRGRARTPHLPTLPSAALEHALGRLPTVKAHGDLATCGQQRVGQRGVLAHVKPLCRGPRSRETPPGVLAAGEAPRRRRGPCPKCDADLHRHGAMGGGGFLCALALGVLMVVGDGVERSGARVFFVSRVIQAHRAGPMGTLLGLGHPGCHDTGTERRPQVLSRPRTAAQRGCPMRGGGSRDQETRQTGDGCVPCCGDHQRSGQASHRLPLWRGQMQGQPTQKGQQCGRMLDNECEPGDSLSGVRFGWHS
jgi:hypothetical protein